MPTDTCGEAIRNASAFLSQHDVPDAAFDARCLLAHCMHCGTTVLRLRSAERLPDGVEMRYSSLLARRAAGEPLQYILGEWDFYDLTFFVRPGVLIPRPETEFLVDEAMRLLPTGGVLYDVCAGTGCIGLSVAAHRPDVTVYLFEKYDDAFAVLRENVQKHALPNACAVQRDMFLGVPDGVPKPDGIVSNPPYIETDDLVTLQREVRQEPREALDGGADGLLFYRALRAIWFPFLQTNGFLSMECGEGQPPKVTALFDGAGWIAPDFSGTPRFVTIQKSPER